MAQQKKAMVPAPSDVEAGGDIGEIRNIRDIVGFHIRLAHGAVYRHFSETFAHLDLTQKQVSLLWLIDDHPDIAQTDLCKLMQMDRATTMAIINRLDSRGYLVRGKSAHDARKQTLNLTDTGRDALYIAKRAIAEHEGWLNSRFTARETATLISLLARIHDQGGSAQD